VETWAGEISSPRCVIAGGGGGGGDARRRKKRARDGRVEKEGGRKGERERERSARASHEVLDGGECYGGCPKIEFAGKRGAFD